MPKNANKFFVLFLALLIGALPTASFAIGPHLPGQKTATPVSASQPVANVVINATAPKANSPISNTGSNTKSLSNKIYHPETNQGVSSANLPSVQDSKKTPATTAAQAAANSVGNKVGGILSGKAINLATTKEKSFVIDYNSYLVNKNGLKIKFYLTADNALLVSFVKNYNGKDYILNKVKVSSNNYSINPQNIYSNEFVIIRSFDKNNISLETKDTSCPTDFPNCFINNYQANTKIYKNGAYQYLYPSALGESTAIIQQYFNKKTNLDKNSVAFLQNKLGFNPPVDTFANVYYYEQGVSAPANATTLFTIQYNPPVQITSESINNLQNGNTHELTHIFLKNINISSNYRWAEEGLAEYTRHLELQGYIPLICNESGWTSDNTPGSNTPYLNYNNLSNYQGFECFWKYIKDNYGENAIKKIGQALNNTRLVYPPQEKRFIHDIVNPALGTDLSSLVQARYGYSE